MRFRALFASGFRETFAEILFGCVQAKFSKPCRGRFLLNAWLHSPDVAPAIQMRATDEQQKIKTWLPTPFRFCANHFSRLRADARHRAAAYDGSRLQFAFGNRPRKGRSGSKCGDARRPDCQCQRGPCRVAHRVARSGRRCAFSQGSARGARTHVRLCRRCSIGTPPRLPWRYDHRCDQCGYRRLRSGSQDGLPGASHDPRTGAAALSGCSRRRVV